MGPEGFQMLPDAEPNKNKFYQELILPQAGVVKRINSQVKTCELHVDLYPKINKGLAPEPI